MLNKLRQLLNKHAMLGINEQTKEALLRERNDAIVKAGELMTLINSNKSGWKEYVEVIEDYIEACQLRKLLTPMDTADDKTINTLKLIDHEVFILKWAVNIPKQVISDVEEMIKQAKDEEGKDEND